MPDGPEFAVESVVRGGVGEVVHDVLDLGKRGYELLVMTGGCGTEGTHPLVILRSSSQLGEILVLQLRARNFGEEAASVIQLVANRTLVVSTNIHRRAE